MGCWSYVHNVCPMFLCSTLVAPVVMIIRTPLPAYMQMHCKLLFGLAQSKAYICRWQCTLAHLVPYVETTATCPSQMPHVHNSRECRDSDHCGGVSKDTVMAIAMLSPVFWFLLCLEQMIDNVGCGNNSINNERFLDIEKKLLNGCQRIVGEFLLLSLPLVFKVSTPTVIVITITGVDFNNNRAAEMLVVAVVVGIMRVCSCLIWVCIQFNHSLIMPTIYTYLCMYISYSAQIKLDTLLPKSCRSVRQVDGQINIVS